MTQFNKQFKKQADALKLSADERRELRARVVSYMEYHPLPQSMQNARVTQRERAWFGAAWVPSFYTRSAVGAFAVLLLVGVSVIAEQSMPGEVLYPVKVRFNEEVQGTLNRTPYEKVVWETELLERRLAEARLLANEGKLTPEVEAEVVAAVKQHSDAAQLSIANIRESDSDEAAIAEIALSSALDVQSEMLEGRSEALTVAVDAARLVAVTSQQTNRPSYEKLLARIELESTNAYELFNTVTDQATAEERKDIERRLEAIRREVANAKNLLSENNEEAVSILTTALADTRKVISFMTNLEVRANVTIDQLIPVALTDEERKEMIEIRMTEARTLETTIRERMTVVDANTQTAVTSRLAEMNTALAAASSSLAINDLDGADDASALAFEIATELIATFDRYDAEIGSTTPETVSTSTGTSTLREGAEEAEEVV